MGSEDEVAPQPAVVAADVRDVAEDELLVTRTARDAFASLVRVELSTIFSACSMRSPPQFVRGAYRAAMRFALEEVELGVDANNEQRNCQELKLFLVWPRMILHPLPKRKLLDRFAAFAQREWTQLLIASSPR